MPTTIERVNPHIRDLIVAQLEDLQIESPVRRANTIDITYYPYRTATAADKIYKLTREAGKHLEGWLHFVFHHSGTNHSVYRITTDSGDTLTVMFSDLEVIIGRSVHEHGW